MTIHAVSRAEVCAVACSDLFRDDGEIFVSPMGTIPMLGAKLARLTHAPDLVLGDGEAQLAYDTVPLGSTPKAAEGPMPYRRVFDIIGWGKRHVVMGGAQIDQYGNQNLSCIGDHRRPDRQLLGTRGAASNTVQNKTSYWIPRHSSRVFVPEVDFVTGLGPNRAHDTGRSAAAFNQIHQVVTNLGVFDFQGPSRSMRAVSIHPGVSTDDVRRSTSFDIDISHAVETRVPDRDELQLIRAFLDPHSLRDGEVP